jgi:transposase
LEAVLADRNSPQKHVWRARIILATAEGCGTTEVMRRAGVSKPCVWRWQRRFMESGVDGLVHDKTRKPGKAPVPDHVVARLIERTLGDPRGETTHWTSRAMASAMGLAISTVQKIWRAYGLAPHRLRTFKLSRDPQFAAKVRDVVGLYVDPPAHYRQSVTILFGSACPKGPAPVHCIKSDREVLEPPDTINFQIRHWHAMLASSLVIQSLPT